MVSKKLGFAALTGTLLIFSSLVLIQNVFSTENVPTPSPTSSPSASVTPSPTSSTTPSPIPSTTPSPTPSTSPTPSPSLSPAPSPTPPIVHPKPMVVEINNSGHALIRGVLVSVSTNSLVITSWGGNWTINVSSDTQVMPKVKGISSDIANFKASDFIGVQGKINTSASFTIDASLVRDWTYHETLKEVKAKNYEGVASNINSTDHTLTLTSGVTVYSVSLTTDAQVLSRNRQTLNFAEIQANDTVRVYGPLVGSSITASVLRDVSIPR